MVRVVAEVPDELKKWFQWQTIARDTTMSNLVQQAMEEFKDREGGDIPSATPAKAKK